MHCELNGGRVSVRRSAWAICLGIAEGMPEGVCVHLLAVLWRAGVPERRQVCGALLVDALEGK